MIRGKLGQSGQEKLIAGGVVLTRIHHLTTQLHHLQRRRPSSYDEMYIMRKVFYMNLLTLKKKNS